MKKNKFLLTVFIPLLLSIIAGIVIIILNSTYVINSRASAIAAKEKSDMNKEISALLEEQQALKAAISDYDSVLEENEKSVSELEFLNSELSSYTSYIESVSAKIAEADAKIAEKTAFLGSITDIAPETQGEKKSFTEGEYKSPSQISAGRYLAEGDGTLYVYTISNALRLKENLSLISSHSYTFEISSGETLKVEGTLSLTELTQ